MSLGDDEDELPVIRHVMRGAEGPGLSIHERPLLQVIQDHAVQVWGRLRNRDQLDSLGAVTILAEEMQKLLAMYGKAPPPARPRKRRRGLDVLGRPKSPGRPRKEVQVNSPAPRSSKP